MPSQSHITHRKENGLTLVELMVAMALSGLIITAGMAALVLALRGFSTVDSASQIRDNQRFATSIMRRVITQAGYLETKNAVDQGSDFKTRPSDEIEPNIKGFENSAYDSDLVLGTTNTIKKGFNNSDMLVVRYRQGEDYTNSSGDTDSSMINCSGSSPEKIDSSIDNPTKRMMSVFYVASSTGGEPALMCSWSDKDGYLTKTPQPLIQGVESLQILYGVDGVTPGAAPTATEDSVPERYLRADELTVNGNNAGTLDNWRRVRSIRIGMVMRGAVNSAPPETVPAQYPLGPQSIMDSTADAGSIFPASNDRRLRQIVTFTVHLRNPQGS